MRKISYILILICFIALLTGCSKKDKDNKNDNSEADIPEFSSEYLVGFNYGGSSWGEYYDCISAGIIICTNHNLEIYMPTKVDEPYSVSDTQLIETLTLTDEQYNNIEKAVDRKKLYTMIIENDDDVCDGSSFYLVLYDKNQEIAKR